jgi:predicted GIY-YIG superfamily endonuclease
MSRIRTMTCYVYVIGVEGHDLVKVGVTQDVNKRLVSLQTASPFKLSLVCSFGFPSREHALHSEYAFHTVLKDN